MTDFDYGKYFSRVRNAWKMQVRKDDVNWLETSKKPQPRHSVVLYLGCNVFRTAHLAVEITRVFERLGIDFVAVGGPSFCCGAVHDIQKDRISADNIGNSTLDKVSEYNPDVMVTWCPECNNQYEDRITNERALGFPIIHATEFLMDYRDRMPWVKEFRGRVALHGHDGRRPEDSARAAQLIAAVPGVTFLGSSAIPDLGNDCGYPTPPKLGREHFHTLIESEREKLLALGADTIATIYHPCQREWAKFTNPNLSIKNYISIIATALDCAYDDTQTLIVHAKTPKQVVSETTDFWQSNGLNSDEAQAIASYDVWPEHKGQADIYKE
ncbi:heterodisulfide reductase-related iron-sulfur binding cluster [Castellaniella sp. GW247-6E4]|uniref:heterodisulfide reductase-related iron-sulfur binding cluster n=1 Tax=Castellaniella sp. GW247-6E4 TaxID=3140380 RepID=UPI0033145A76